MGLIKAAKEAQKKAYAPYSKFLVGCAVEMASGKVYAGCNVENVSYGATICAERVAITSAVAGGDKLIKRLAIVATTDKPVVPCGMCLQVIAEFGPTVEIICSNNDMTEQKIYHLTDLLPQGFDKSFLAIKAD